ncbi:MaoC/PaaZ C-terminal domain-containing protein [Priestia koreensis]|uniref:MaoC/PaaZ C-terminal domain-containing protein n=1 Tax=Priestia koreensis TaxID=284581 RepID=UPI001F5ACB03|nr:MaoC/PaaZ C-terminal domain-containing protein [Priestia koreensis]MCM3002776.1 enoyl-CoA hydratase [Priestia koreensis]UNL84471.1 MaoC family dehydratase N-terminal domain-containing protein [Priestia koreensis]
MILGKKRKLGRTIAELSKGEKLSLTERIEDRELLLYLGLTNDANPLYIQHDYASQTPLKKPVVPAIMLTGTMMSAISKYIPGPGSHILHHTVTFHKQVYHYELIEYLFEIKDIDHTNHTITVLAKAVNEEKDLVIDAEFIVCPPYSIHDIDEQTLENF